MIETTPSTAFAWMLISGPARSTSRRSTRAYPATATVVPAGEAHPPSRRATPKIALRRIRRPPEAATTSAAS